MRLREVVSGSAAFAWRRRRARATSWVGQFLGASTPPAGRHLPGFARGNAPAFGTCLTEMTDIIFDDVPAGEPAQATRRRVTTPAGGQADSKRTPRLRRARPADEATPGRPAGPAARPRALAPLTAAVPSAVSRSKLATLARDIPPAWPGSGPSRTGHHSVRRPVPASGAAGTAPPEGSAGRRGAATISGGGAANPSDRATASTILGRRLKARAGYALAAACGPAFRAGRLPLGAAAGWSRTIAGPCPDLVLIDPDPQPPAAAAGSGPRPEPESGPRPAAESRPGRRSAAPVPAYGAIPRTGPPASRDTPPAPRHEGFGAADASTTETGVTADGAPALDPPATAAHLGALTAPDRRHRYFPAVAAPLSVAESRAEERQSFDPLEFAEHIRVALIDDARRHGIGV
jgi:hypothetical protein